MSGGPNQVVFDIVHMHGAHHLLLASIQVKFSLKELIQEGGGEYRLRFQLASGIKHFVMSKTKLIWIGTRIRWRSKPPYQ